MAPAVNNLPSRLMGSARCITGSWALLLLCACTSGTKPIEPGFSRVSWNNASADIYVVDTRVSRIAVYGHNSKHTRIESFEGLREHLDTAQGKLDFATNGGMFHSNFEPVGLLVEDGIEHAPINLSPGEGNFFLKPNGVFAISRDGEAVIVPSEDYPKLRVGVSAATQSGPMLLIDEQINSVFKAGSPNRVIRSGVGLIDSHTVVFAISKEPVNFWDFARLFRDQLGCKDALFLDGVISEFYVPGGESRQQEEEFGVLIGVTKIP